MRRIAVSLITGWALHAAPADAHHSVLHYDGKTEVTITGTVTRARFGFPHSVYRLDVTADDGSIEKWVLSTEDPRDAERLGFADEIKSLKRGDTITVVGWPHRFRERELRGHQLHYPDGRVVMMRRGNYIWPRDILRLDRLVMNPSDIAVTNIDSGQPIAEQVALWIDEDDHIARAAFEVTQERPRLIGLSSGGTVEFAGVGELLSCHTERPDFAVTIAVDEQPAEIKDALANGADYISEYNRALSRWWEQERSSCQ
ncbi:MAG: DUF6152 family protein [Pseudomonadota bacterium]